MTGTGAVSGEEHANARLTWDAVRRIRASTASDSALAVEFEVSRTTIRLVRANLMWRDPEYTPRTSPRSPFRVRSVLYSGQPCTTGCRWVDVRDGEGRVTTRTIRRCREHLTYPGEG